MSKKENSVNSLLIPSGIKCKMPTCLK